MTQEEAQQKTENTTPIAEPTCEERLKEQEDKYLRLLAEMENLRKRLAKEREEMLRFAKENVIAEFLTALDNFEKALGLAEKSSEEVRHWAKGFEMILEQFKEILAAHDVHPFKSEGHPFNPETHEAVEIEETNQHPDGIVIAEFIQGYKVGHRTLRPARVKVAKVKSSMEEEKS